MSVGIVETVSVVVVNQAGTVIQEGGLVTDFLHIFLSAVEKVVCSEVHLVAE